MIVEVRAKTRSKVERLIQRGPGLFEIAVHAAPVDGEANDRIQSMLAKHFGVGRSRIVLKRGHRSKIKIFEIEDA